MTIPHDELLAMLRFQLEAGADERVENTPCAPAPVNTAPANAAPVSTAPVSTAPVSAAPVSAARKTVEETAPHTQMPSTAWLDGIESLEGLEAGCRDFTCDLRKTATNMVFADGNAASPLMVIGEAPGADEDRQGKPFVGASGRLLDKMLASIGIGRDAVYITNILLWRPPGNRTPSAEEAALFLPIIRKHIELAAPKVIFAVGGSAAKTLLGKNEGILKLRGKFHDYDNGSGGGGRNGGNGEAGGEAVIPLLPSLHPSYLLRSPGQKQLAWRDLRLLKKRLDG